MRSEVDDRAGESPCDAVDQLNARNDHLAQVVDRGSLCNGDHVVGARHVVCRDDPLYPTNFGSYRCCLSDFGLDEDVGPYGHWMCSLHDVIDTSSSRP